MKFNDAFFGAFFAVLGALILVQVQGFPAIPGQQYGAGAFPGLVGTGFVVAGLLLIVLGVRDRAGASWATFDPWLRSRRHVTAAAAIVLGTVAYILWVDDIGFLLLAPAVLLLWFLLLGVRPLPAVITALVAVALIWYVFYKLLRVPLPWGWLKSFAF
jgi:putative tricarboxylic transport membrane protein